MPPDRPAPEPIDLDKVGTFEADQFHRMSAWAGHAGPHSSYPYINQYEEPLLALTRGARPLSWGVAPSAQALEFFADLAEDPVAPSRFATDVGTPSALIARTSDVGLKARLDLTIQIGKGRSDDVAAAYSRLDLRMALDVLLEVHDAMEVARLIRRKARSTTDAIAAVRAFSAWVMAARAAKLVELEKVLEARIHARDIASLRSLFESWRQVRVREHLCMDDGYTASAFLKSVQGLGLDRKAMLIKSRKGAPPLDRSVAAMKLPIGCLEYRAGMVQHRLQFTEPDVSPDEACGKQVSSAGFHWLMVLVTSWLRSVGDSSWS